MRPSIRRPIALAATLLVAACASEPAPRAVPRPVVVSSPRPPMPVPARVSADWRDWPLTPGDWVYRRDAAGSIALFGAVGGDALLTLRCDRERHRLYLSRQGNATATLTVRTTTLDQGLAMLPTGASPAYVAAALVPHELLLDQMAFSRGRFVVEQPGTPTLVVPAWAEIGRVIEDCRA